MKTRIKTVKFKTEIHGIALLPTFRYYYYHEFKKLIARVSRAQLWEKSLQWGYPKGHSKEYYIKRMFKDKRIPVVKVRIS